MPTMKLGEELEAAPPEHEATAPKTVAVYNSTKDLANATGQQPWQESEGEWNASDVKLPYFKLVQKSSAEALHDFGLGAIVFDDSVKLGDTKNPIPFVVLRMKKTYRQWLPQESEERPQVFDRMEDARAAGFTLGYTKAPNFVSEQALLQLAAKAPADTSEDDLNRFAYTDPAGNHWAMGLMNVGGTSYGSLVKALNMFKMPGQALTDGMVNGLFEMHIEAKSAKKFSWYQPKPLFKGRHSDADAAFFKSLTGQ